MARRDSLQLAVNAYTLHFLLDGWSNDRPADLHSHLLDGGWKHTLLDLRAPVAVNEDTKEELRH